MNTTKLVFIILSCIMSQHAQAQRYDRFRDMTSMYGWKNQLDVWPARPTYGIRFSDRLSIVIINIPNYLNSSSERTFLVPSVLIDKSRLLTAYNPFRDIIRNPEVADKLVVALPQSYTLKHVVGVHISEIVCGRQIVYMPDDEVEHWHGVDRKHSPVHDLMVFRGDEEFLYTGFTDYLNYDAKVENRDWNMNAPIMTYLAGKYEKPGNIFRIYSLGYRTKKEMRNYNKIYPLEITPVEHFVVDCEEWMPRNWGYFICLKNEGGFAGLGAGAMLFSNHRLFGVGSFAMFRNNTGIMVFTDIRPYLDILNKTCTDEEFSFDW